MTAHTVKTIERDGRWIAYAEHTDTGSRFGVEVSGATAAEATERMQRWLDWQQAHTDALQALQRAEQAYYRTIAGSAFANPTEGPSALEMQKEALQVVEAARIALDEIRARRPE